MTVKVTDDDVSAALVADKAWKIENDFNPSRHASSVGSMRAALESFIARHPELAPQRAMHEPVKEEEISEFRRFLTVNDWRTLSGEPTKQAIGKALTEFLARRAAAAREPVLVTGDMYRECLSAWRRNDAVLWIGHVEHCLDWLADRINGKHEKPVDPRVEKLAAILRDAGMDADKAQAAAARATAELGAELDKAKP